MNEQVVVRFAPSPTGYLHIGGARTAIFNWLYAKKHNGKFILRIEDTDTERSTKDSIQGIIDGLEWLGLDWDEGPNFQSDNIQKHQEAARTLVKKGHAYKCFCTKEAIDAQRDAAVKNKETYQYDRRCRSLSPEAVAQKEAAGIPFAVRLKIPREDDCVSFDDAVYGSVTKQYRDLDDFIIVRSNKKPLYILSNAVDDIQDKVTHIIRGQDGLANTPKQVLLYNALEAPLPVFAHMSLTLDPNKAKISKRRHGEMVAIHFYREKGFLPWALVNFLVLLGWATRDSREIFSTEELIQAFNLKGISKTNSVFNINQDDPKFFTDPKALNINAHYIKTMGLEALADHVKAELVTHGLWDDRYENDQKEWFLNAIELIRSQCLVVTDFIPKGRTYFSDEFEIDPRAFKTHIQDNPDMAQWLLELSREISRLEPFTEQTIEQLLRKTLKEREIKPGILINAMRVALTGQAKGPDFMKSLVVIGQKRLVQRLEAIASI